MSSRPSQDSPSEKVLQHRPEHDENREAGVLEDTQETEAEPVVTLKTWIVVFVSVSPSKLG